MGRIVSGKMWRIVFCCTWWGIALGLPGRIHVGGLFETEDEEQEMCFRIAVDWLNTDEALLKNSRMIAAVERLSSEDSFKATKQCCGLLQKGLAAVFGPQSDLPSMHVQSICEDLEVPHVETRWQYRLRRDQLSVNLYPHPSVLSKAFVQLVTVWGWREFFLVYEEDEAIIRMKDFLQEAETKGWTIKMYQFPNASSYRDVFWDIKKSITRRAKNITQLDYKIVLDVPRKNLHTVLKSAQQVGMITERQKYLITSLDMHTINMEDFQYGKTNITGLRLVQEDLPEFHLLLEEVNNRLARKRDMPPLHTLRTESALIYDSVKLLAMALESMDLAKNVAVFPPISCNLMNKGIDGTSLVNYIKDGQLKGLSGLVNFDVEGFRTNIQLDVMYVTPKGIKKIGFMTPGSTINITHSDSSDFEFMELENKHYKVTTYPNDPYMMLKESTKELFGNERFEGYGIDILNELAAHLKFTYEIHIVKDMKYGSLDNNTGVWNGMIGEIVSGEADMAIADLTITTERLKGVDFTLPFMQTGISILFKKPTTKVTSLFSFLSPFSGEVWILVMAAYTFISISFFLVGRLSQYEWANPHPCRQTDTVEENVFSLLNSMWFAIGSLMQQGSDIAPTAMSTRAITSIWYFFCLIMISSYTANLAAFLTVEKTVSPIESAEDLSNQEAIKYGCLSSGTTKRFFQISTIETFKRMGRFMERNKDVMMDTNGEAIARVERGNYAYLMEASSIEYNIERKCNLTQVGGMLDTKGYGIAVMKGNHKLSAWLSGGILHLQEKGYLHNFKERWWKQKKGGGSCSEASAASGGGVNELGLGNVGGVFVVMLLGLCLSAVVGVVEFLWFQRKIHRDDEMPMFKLLLREVKFAVTCGSSSKAAPKMIDKAKEEEEPTKGLPGYNSLF